MDAPRKVVAGTSPAHIPESLVTTFPAAHPFTLNLFTLNPLTLNLLTLDLLILCPPHWTTRA